MKKLGMFSWPYNCTVALGSPAQVNIRSILELLPIRSSVVNMIPAFVRNEQSTRKYLLVNAAA